MIVLDPIKYRAYFQLALHDRANNLIHYGTGYRGSIRTKDISRTTRRRECVEDEAKRDSKVQQKQEAGTTIVRQDHPP